MSTATLAPFQAREHLDAELACLDRALWILLQLFHANDSESGGQGWFLPRRQVESWLTPASPSPEIESLRKDLRDARKYLRSQVDSTEGEEVPALASLARKFALSPVEQVAILVCLAPEIDAKYGKIYAYLQDDLTRRLPSLDLAGRIAAEFGEAPERLWAWSSHAPLFRYGLVQFASENEVAHRLSLGISLHESVRAYLLEPVAARVPSSTPQGTPSRLAQSIRANPGQVVIQFHGPSFRECLQSAKDACAELELDSRLESLAAFTTESRGVPKGLLEAILYDCALLVSIVDTHDDAKTAARLAALEAALPLGPRLQCILSAQPWFPLAIPAVITFLSRYVPLPEFEERRRRWSELLVDHPELESHDVATLASRYRLPRSDMEQALQVARQSAQLLGVPLTLSDLRTACRARSRSVLGSLARLITPKQRWENLVLPEHCLEQLREICAQVRQRVRVFHEWGFDARLSAGKGLYALFLGPSGTGKTLAAEVVAKETGLDLLKVDLSSVVSKYIGETEKNLQRVFDGAESADAILFFDEADALFGKRSAIKDAHDRYANIEINFLLQRLEEFEGVAILASNFAQNIDDAFTRRIQVTVEFPFPDERSRAAIWKSHLPSATPVDPDIDFGLLAKRIPLPGGNIRNIVLNAAFLAAEDAAPVGMTHLLRALRREYEKLGKPYREEDVTR